MTEEELDKRIEAANEKYVPDEVEPGEQQLPQEPVDYYDKQYKQTRDERQKTYPRGASPKMCLDAEIIIKQLGGKFRAAQRESSILAKRGDIMRSRMLKEQYMNDNFLPSITALVDMYSADELLSSPNIMSALDDYVLIDGGSGRGYTQAYVKSLYDNEMGGTISKSDGYIRNSMIEMRTMVEHGNIRGAVGKATKLMKEIDGGEHQASEDDYQTIQKVALRGQ